MPISLSQRVHATASDRSIGISIKPHFHKDDNDYVFIYSLQICDDGRKSVDFFSVEKVQFEDKFEGFRDTSDDRGYSTTKEWITNIS